MSLCQVRNTQTSNTLLFDSAKQARYYAIAHGSFGVEDSVPTLNDTINALTRGETVQIGRFFDLTRRDVDHQDYEDEAVTKLRRLTDVRVRRGVAIIKQQLTDLRNLQRQAGIDDRSIDRQHAEILRSMISEVERQSPDKTTVEEEHLTDLINKYRRGEHTSD